MIHRQFPLTDGDTPNLDASRSEIQFDRSMPLLTPCPQGTASVGPGYRLRKLEVLNWGTFDRQVYTVRPEGLWTLLVGHNGCGKSTLVDALLTLLVKPGVRNFNVASGAHKRERTERTYFEGVFDRNSDDNRQEIRTRSLRPKRNHTSVILASFQNAYDGKAFTLAQVIYWTGQNLETIYCFSDTERSIVSDFGGLESTDGLLRELKERGFQTTRNFKDYDRWFTKVARGKSKAMEVFNQTVAVKDIERLNDFIRNHMLEPHNWSERVDGLLEHFTQLNEAHQSLMRVRGQLEFLKPVVKLGETFRIKANALERAKGVLTAVDAFFLHKTIEIFTPERERRQRRLTDVREARDSFEKEIEDVQIRRGRIQSEIDRAGGPRLTQIPLEIEAQQLQANAKKEVRKRYEAALRQIGHPGTVQSCEEFDAVRECLPTLRNEVEQKLVDQTACRDELTIKRSTIRNDLALSQIELEGLSRRRDSLPERCVALRERMCQDLGVPTKDLPFAGELVAVSVDDREWEASIEKVLRGFALSLLVPEKLYTLVSGYAEQTRLTAQGRGQRLVYLRVGEQFSLRNGSAPHLQSLLWKLSFREGHPLVPWVKAEIAHSHDYRCCETVEEFQQCRSSAMTRTRHVKTGQKRHEKDDREQVIDPRNFVLGWDNQEKRKRIQQEIERLSAANGELTRQIEEVDRELSALQERMGVLREVEGFGHFAEIDFEHHERTISTLERERQSIERKSGVIQNLKKHLEEIDVQRKKLQKQQQETSEEEGRLKLEIAQAEKLLTNAKKQLDEFESQEILTSYREYFAELEADLGTLPVEIGAFLGTRDVLRRSNETRVKQLEEQFEPLQKDLRAAMSRFLKTFPEETDLGADCDYLASFQGLYERILHEGLPEHESRFKARLNEKVTQDIGFFRGVLEKEKREIVAKIDVLNTSLRRLDYRPGTYIQLEPRMVRDPEIVDFQRKLKECIEGSFEDSAEANEARFVRIRDLILQLQDENNRRWRNKVIDVRQWFDFVANVIDQHSLEQVSCYDDSTGQSAGEKAKLAFTILVAAIVYQYDLDPEHPENNHFQFVVVDEMFSKVDDQNSEYALELFRQFGLQLLIVAPFDAKARITQPYVGCYVHVHKRNNRSEVLQMSAQEFEELVEQVENEQ